MEEEIWMDVYGYEGIYKVSNLGRVKSLPRMIDNGCSPRKTRERVLKIRISDNGYPYVGLSKMGIQKIARVHLLVAYTFLNYTPSGRSFDVDHINGIKTDPRAINLRIVTHRFNTSEGFRKDKSKLSSIYPGVCWDKGRKKWHSQIYINGRRLHLGRFSNEIDAANAYQNELLKLNL